MLTTRFIAYYRVSTERQRASGLGLEAQTEAVARIARTGQLLAEYTETESGKRADNRPQLQAALAACKAQHATLLIARLDRLSRNVAFIAALMDSGVDFVACDMPEASRLTMHILAAVAEHEREMISARTKAALAAARARGIILGNPRLAEARERARQANTAQLPPPEISGMMHEWRGQGTSFRAVARRLNTLRIRAPRGEEWHGTTVKSVLAATAQPRLDRNRQFALR